MSWTNFESDLKNCRFEFSEDQLRNLKSSCTDMYKILKFVFDSPRKLQKPYTSLDQYKYTKERKLQSPSDFYSFRDDEVQIQLWKRRNAFYSVAIFGDFIPEGVNFEYFVGHEKQFSCGFNFYGKWLPSEFSQAVDTYKYIVRQYIQKTFDDKRLF